MPTIDKHGFLRISDRVTALPVLHGSGDFAVEVRERLLRLEPDCLAVPLPPSFQAGVEEGVLDLPRVSVAVQREDAGWRREGDGEEEDWGATDFERHQEEGGEEAGESLPACSYVPVDPCQPVIAAIRAAMEERVPRAFIDLEVSAYQPEAYVLPDPYALKKVTLEAFTAALLAVAPAAPPGSQRAARIRGMAAGLLRLERERGRVAFVCSAMDWPWVRQAYWRLAGLGEEKIVSPEEGDALPAARLYKVHPDTLTFALGEIPFVTHLYERRREQLLSDRNLSIDGVKELLLEARQAWMLEHGPAHNWVTPQRLQIFLQYVRNLTLRGGRLTPDLFTLVMAAKQCAGDAFALSLVETARMYPYQLSADSPQPSVEKENDEGGLPERPDWLRMGLGRAEFYDGEVREAKNRLGGPEVRWRSIRLKPRPQEFDRRRWAQRWNPYGMCSWPPEDTRIESFHTHVREQAKALLGEDLARSEKFTTSIKDGLDMRETLRNWHTGELYVKEIPPARGNVEVVVFLFDTPADPERYAWRTMWYAEHEEESTLCMYATPFDENLVGPGIAESQYGGAFFVFPPRWIEDVWADPRLAFAKTLEERLIAGACLHSRERFVALVSPSPPTARWRQIARLLKRHLIHIPLGRFSGETVSRIRRFHVLNGRDVRSYAAKFIREM